MENLKIEATDDVTVQVVNEGSHLYGGAYTALPSNPASKGTFVVLSLPGSSLQYPSRVAIMNTSPNETYVELWHKGAAVTTATLPATSILGHTLQWYFHQDPSGLVIQTDQPISVFISQPFAYYANSEEPSTNPNGRGHVEHNFPPLAPSTKYEHYIIPNLPTLGTNDLKQIIRMTTNKECDIGYNR